jgi:hypothetical protein
MPRDSSPTIGEFKVGAVRVPMTQAHRSARGVVTESPLVLTDVITDAGITGHSMVFTYAPAALKPTAEAPALFVPFEDVEQINQWRPEQAKC